MSEQALSDAEVIDALGGTVKTARLFKIKPSVVSNWRNRGIPGRYQYAVSKVCTDLKIRWTPRGPQPAEQSMTGGDIQ
jgi:hypothetical protein